MITPKCDCCAAELKEFGGILLGPPDAQNKVDKRHICVFCYEYLLRWIEALAPKRGS